MDDDGDWVGEEFSLPPLTPNDANPWRRQFEIPEHIAGLEPLGVMEPELLEGDECPEREWVVDGWVPMRQTTILSGEGGIGKSLLALQLLTAVAIGENWLGCKTVAGRALGMFCEDAMDELWRRQVDINHAFGIGWRDLRDLRWAPRVGEDNHLANVDLRTGKLTPSDLFYQLVEEAQRLDCRLVMLDSLHDLFPGNENDRVQARSFVQILTKLAMAIDGAVVLLSHPSQAGLSSGSGTSGSTAWNNAVRSRMYLHSPAIEDGEDEDTDRRVLSSKKANYTARGNEIELRWQDGVFVRQMANGHDQQGGLFTDDVEAVYLKLLDAMWKQGRLPAPAPQATDYPPKVMARRSKADREGWSRKDFTRAQETLLDKGEIVIETVTGSDRHARRVITRKTT